MRFSDDSPISVVVTSCGRFDLLKRTLDSFDQFNTAPIRRVFITEDSGDEAVHAAIPAHWKTRTRVFVNRPRRGQMASIDLAYAAVSTPLLFHLEDDWEFYREGFVEDSLAVLDTDPKIVTVWLRSYAHDMRSFAPFHHPGPLQSVGAIRYQRVLSDNPAWTGFSLNPGLRRMADYAAVAPFAAFATEKAISVRYGKLGFYAVSLQADAVLHTGGEAHVSRPEDDRRARTRRMRQRIIAGALVVLAFALGFGLGRA